MKRLTVLCLAVTAVACGVGTDTTTSSDPADEYRAASPSRQGLTLGVSRTSTAGKTEQGLGGGPISGLYLATAGVTRTINGHVRGTLDRVEDIISNPPTQVDQNHAVWGPMTDPLSPVVLRFVVERQPVGMRYALEGKPRQAPDTAYLPVLLGEHRPDPSSSAVVGQFFVNREGLRMLGDPAEAGATAVEFARSAHGDVMIRVNMRATAPGALLPSDSSYVYNQQAGGDGAFEFRTDRDLNDNGVFEHTAIRARWHQNGAGQAEAAATGGDLQQNVAHIVECWNSDFELTFGVDTNGLRPPFGDPASCTFQQQGPPPPPPSGP